MPSGIPPKTWERLRRDERRSGRPSGHATGPVTGQFPGQPPVFPYGPPHPTSVHYGGQPGFYRPSEGYPPTAGFPSRVVGFPPATSFPPPVSPPAAAAAAATNLAPSLIRHPGAATTITARPIAPARAVPVRGGTPPSYMGYEHSARYLQMAGRRPPLDPIQAEASLRGRVPPPNPSSGRGFGFGFRGSGRGRGQGRGRGRGW